MYYDTITMNVNELALELTAVASGTPTTSVCNDPIYAGDVSSVWDDLGQRTVARLIVYGQADGSSLIIRLDELSTMFVLQDGLSR